MKVVHVLWSGEIGGIERVVYDLACAQRQQGLEVVLLMGQGKGLFYDQALAADLPVVSLGLRSGFDGRLTAVSQALHLLQTASVVHYHAFLPVAAIAGILARRPLVYSDHGHDLTQTTVPLSKRFKKKLQALFVRRFCHVTVANSHFTQQLAQKAFGLPPERVQVVHNGIDVSQLRPSQSREQTRAAFNIPATATVIGTICRLARFKRVDRLLESVCLLPPDHHYRLLIVGDGPDAPALRQQAHALGIADKVIFAGFRADVGNILQALDQFVLPSQGEPFGIAILEALAVGLPVFTFADVGGANEIITQPIPIFTPQDMAHALTQPQKPPSFALAYFGIERMANQLQPIYQELTHA